MEYNCLPSEDHNLQLGVLPASEHVAQLSTDITLEAYTSLRTITVDPAENVPLLKVYALSEEGKSSWSSMPTPKQELDYETVNPVCTTGTYDITLR